VTNGNGKTVVCQNEASPNFSITPKNKTNLKEKVKRIGNRKPKNDTKKSNEKTSTCAPNRKKTLIKPPPAAAAVDVEPANDVGVQDGNIMMGRDDETPGEAVQNTAEAKFSRHWKT